MMILICTGIYRFMKMKRIKLFVWENNLIMYYLYLVPEIQKKTNANIMKRFPHVKIFSAIGGDRLC